LEQNGKRGGFRDSYIQIRPKHQKVTIQTKQELHNQAEQLAILKALEYIDSTQTTDKTATIYTDSPTTLDMLQNSKIHANIIEDIRRRWYEMKKAGWQIYIRWVKAHAGTEGNELADKLAKKVT
jgi:ribonuclease HI